LKEVHSTAGLDRAPTEVRSATSWARMKFLQHLLFSDIDALEIGVWAGPSASGLLPLLVGAVWRVGQPSAPVHGGDFLPLPRSLFGLFSIFSNIDTLWRAC